MADAVSKNCLGAQLVMSHMQGTMEQVTERAPHNSTFLCRGNPETLECDLKACLVSCNRRRWRPGLAVSTDRIDRRVL